jgi:hypothetical protein
MFAFVNVARTKTSPTTCHIGRFFEAHPSHILLHYSLWLPLGHWHLCPTLRAQKYNFHVFWKKIVCVLDTWVFLSLGHSRISFQMDNTWQYILWHRSPNLSIDQWRYIVLNVKHSDNYFSYVKNLFCHQVIVACQLCVFGVHKVAFGSEGR